MKILVTGASGCVGSHIVEEARKRDHEVRALVRSSTFDERLQRLGAEVVRGDLGDAASLQRAVQGVSHIVHCAAVVGAWGHASEYKRINVEGTRALFEAARKANVEHFVHISSLGVYPATDHHGTKEEELVPHEGLDGYTRSKLAAEQVLTNAVAEMGGRCTILRPGFIYGPRDRQVLPRLLRRLRAKKLVYVGDGLQLLNNTYVKNLVAAVFLAFENGKDGLATYNVTDGNLVTRKEFISSVAKTWGLEEPRLHLPRWLMSSLAISCERFATLFGAKTEPPITAASVKFLSLNLHFSIDKIRRELGYDPPYTFAEGLSETFAEGVST